MKLIRYLIFVIFDLAYKDGTRPKNADPHFATLAILLFYEANIFLTTLFFLDKYIIPGIDAFIFKHVENVVYGSGMLIFIIIYPPTYYYFIKKKKLDAFYQEFRYATVNTRRNRKIGYICSIILMVISFASVFFLAILHSR